MAPTQPRDMYLFCLIEGLMMNTLGPSFRAANYKIARTKGNNIWVEEETLKELSAHLVAIVLWLGG